MFEEIYKNESGIFMPIDIIVDKRLNWTEKGLLSFYRHWTNSETHGCCKTDACVIDELHLDRRTFYRMKKHLRELGMIECDGTTTRYTKE